MRHQLISKSNEISIYKTTISGIFYKRIPHNQRVYSQKCLYICSQKASYIKHLYSIYSTLMASIEVYITIYIYIVCIRIKYDILTLRHTQIYVGPYAPHYSTHGHFANGCERKRQGERFIMQAIFLERAFNINNPSFYCVCVVQ